MYVISFSNSKINKYILFYLYSQVNWGIVFITIDSQIIKQDHKAKLFIIIQMTFFRRGGRVAKSF